jgi:hypothetical protein
VIRGRTFVTARGVGGEGRLVMVMVAYSDRRSKLVLEAQGMKEEVGKKKVNRESCDEMLKKWKQVGNNEAKKDIKK